MKTEIAVNRAYYEKCADAYAGDQLTAEDAALYRDALGLELEGIVPGSELKSGPKSFKDAYKEGDKLQLRVIKTSLENGWTLKDASPFNIQWVGSRPVFIDIPSFEPRVPGEPWVGYRQFCSMFLTPLLLRAHLGTVQNPPPPQS